MSCCLVYTKLGPADDAVADSLPASVRTLLSDTSLSCLDFTIEFSASASIDDLDTSSFTADFRTADSVQAIRKASFF